MFRSKLFTLILFGSLSLLIMLLSKTVKSAPSISTLDNVQQAVIEAIMKDGESEFFVLLAEQADLSGAKELSSKEEKGRYVFQRLTDISVRTQAKIVQMLEEEGAEYQSFWISNMILVSGDEEVLQDLAGLNEIKGIYANPQIMFDVPEPANQLLSPSQLPLWNISAVGADTAWAQGINGQGVVIGGQDTGYRWDHPALKDQYRGWKGTSVDHNYNWHDGIHTVNPFCPADSKEPCDDHGHGTHTIGTAVGSDGPGYEIGVAPGAKWIGCRNMDQGRGTPSSYSECFQWFIAPTDLNGQNPNPDMSPDIINNSWSCSESEGCTFHDILRTIVDNVRAAGILTVHSAGNTGPGCETISSPAAIYDSALTVGATDISGALAGFSSRGPVAADLSYRLKPDVSAPGVSIFSSSKDGGYSMLSGTSMAAPHVAGLAALILSADPSLRGDPDALEQAILTSAVPTPTNEVCGQVPAGESPNNSFGAGIISFSRYLHFNFWHSSYSPITYSSYN